MTEKTALARIRKYKPKSWKEFQSIGLPLNKKRLGEGAFRLVYKFVDLPLVVKFPITQDCGSTRSSKYHTTMEVKKVKKLSRFKWLKWLMPKIYYHDRKTGVMVMQCYEPYTKELDWGIAWVLGEALTRATKTAIGDIQASNFGVEHDRFGNKKLKLIDLGL